MHENEDVEYLDLSTPEKAEAEWERLKANHRAWKSKVRAEQAIYEHRLIYGQVRLAPTWWGALYVLAVGFYLYHNPTGYRLWALSAKWRL